MEEIYRELLYREIGKYAVRDMGEINFDELVEKRAIKALREIQDVLLDDNIDETEKTPHIETVFIKYGFEGSGAYE